MKHLEKPCRNNNKKKKPEKKVTQKTSRWRSFRWPQQNQNTDQFHFLGQEATQKRNWTFIFFLSSKCQGFQKRGLAKVNKLRCRKWHKKIMTCLILQDTKLNLTWQPLKLCHVYKLSTDGRCLHWRPCPPALSAVRFTAGMGSKAQ